MHLLSFHPGGLNGWCFLCEFQLHVERVIHSWEPFSPIARLSELPNIGGNLSCVKQEDAHEFMRYVVASTELMHIWDNAHHGNLIYQEECVIMTNYVIICGVCQWTCFRVTIKIACLVGLLLTQCNQRSLMNLVEERVYLLALRKQLLFSIYLVVTFNLR